MCKNKTKDKEPVNGKTSQDTQSNDKKQPWEYAKIEYEIALTQYDHYTSLRRQDMAFVTTVQIAVLTIIGQNLLQLDSVSIVLSIVAIFVLLLGLNNDRRLSLKMAGFKNRAKEIEEAHNLSLISSTTALVSEKKFSISNSIVFLIYYGIFCLSWIAIWVINCKN